MLDGLRVVFLEALGFADASSREELVKEWNKACEEVYKYKNAIIEEEHYKATVNIKTARAEAIKDFVERLKKELQTGVGVMRVSVIQIIDNLAAEMKGGLPDTNVGNMKGGESDA